MFSKKVFLGKDNKWVAEVYVNDRKTMIQYSDPETGVLFDETTANEFADNAIAGYTKSEQEEQNATPELTEEEKKEKRVQSLMAGQAKIMLMLAKNNIK